MSLDTLEEGVLSVLLRYVHDVPALCRCSAVCKDWRSALTNVELGRFADVWEHVYRSSWKEIPDIREKKWNLREEAIRAHCLAHHELQDEEFTQVDLTKRGPSTQKYAVIHVECVCAALGGTVVVAAGSGRTLKKRGHDVALAVVLKEGDGQKLGTLLHSEDHDCIDSVVEIAHGHVATSVCSRDLVGIGSTIKIWDLRGEKNCVVQVIPSGGNYGWASACAAGSWLAASCYDGCVDVFSVVPGDEDKGEQLHASWWRRIECATEAGCFEVSPRACFLASSSAADAGIATPGEESAEWGLGEVLVTVCPLPREVNRGHLWRVEDGALVGSFELRRTRMVRGVTSTAGLIVTWTEDDVQILSLKVEGPLKRIDDGRMVSKGSQVLCCAAIGGKLVMLEQQTQPLHPGGVVDSWLHVRDVQHCTVSRGAPKLRSVPCSSTALLFPGATLCLGRTHVVFACGQYVSEEEEEEQQGAGDLQESAFLIHSLPFVPQNALR